jgi:hypothetical protein
MPGLGWPCSLSEHTGALDWMICFSDVSALGCLSENSRHQRPDMMNRVPANSLCERGQEGRGGCRLVITQPYIAEMLFKMLCPNLLVAFQCGSAKIRLTDFRIDFLRPRNVHVVPEVGHGHVSPGRLRAVNAAHKIVAQEFDSLAGSREMFVVFAAEKLRLLNSTWFTVYNLCIVIADVESSRCRLENMTGLMPAH